MISPKTVQVTKYCGVFLFLLIFLPFDLAFTLTVSLYLAANSKTYSKLLAISLILFVTEILLRHSDISIRFISDLALDSYVLLLTSLFIYLKSQERILLLLKSLGESHRKLISMHTFAIVGISSIFSLLLAPIIGIPFAVVIGYISFSYFSKHFDGKYAYTAGLFVLFFCPFLIIAKRDNISENFAIISFYFLIIGTVQEIIRQVKERKGESQDRAKEAEPFSSSLRKNNFSVQTLQLIQNFRLTQNAGQLIRFIFIVGIAALVSFAVFFIGIRNKLSINSINTIITSKFQKISPTLVLNPSVFPNIPTTTDISGELSSISAQLKIRVENGTEIYGLAASTAARLKDKGFKNVDTGDAIRNDYKNWEITPKKDNEALINYIKKELKLDILMVNKASESAKFDLLIIAGGRLP